MNMYELEDIDESIKRTVIEQLGLRAAFHMERRSLWGADGNDTLVRAINRRTGDYLMVAPRTYMLAFRFRFYFYFKGQTYDLKMRSYSHAEVVIEPGLPAEDVRSEFKAALREAFRVHGVRGHRFCPELPIVPIFHDEVMPSDGGQQ